MKKLLVILLILSAVIMLISCGSGNENETNDTNDMNQTVNSEVVDAKYTLSGTVTKIEAEALYINVLDTTSASGTYMVRIISGTKIYDKNGKTIEKTQISLGDTVEIGYNGQVTKSLPPQIIAIKIQII